ncbi:FmdB family zinc ribbon protein [Naumannella cuiyingiana]
MATYEFTCRRCGGFDLSLPMSQAAARARCPRCGNEARRRYTAPALRTISAGLSRAADLADGSAERPRVVRAIPPAVTAPGPMGPAHPLQARLPRS